MDPDAISREEQAENDAAGDVQAEVYDFVRDLVQIRRAHGLSVEEVAERVGWPPEAVVDFETWGSDPYLSEVRRYALAVGAMVSHELVEDGADSPPT